MNWYQRRIAQSQITVDQTMVSMRRQICHLCTDRPEKCWKSREYDCTNKFKAAEKAATEYGECPLGKWGIRCERMLPLHIPSIKTVVYTIERNRERQERARKILLSEGFKDWSFFFGTTEGPYWQNIPREHAKLLRENEPPFLILEDDIEPREFQEWVRPPSKAQIVYLGGGRGGDTRGIRAAKANLPDLPIFRTYRYGYTPIDDEWMRIYGMWFSHAILYLDRQSMLEVADTLERNHRPIDTTLALEQYRWFVACRKVPLWWQNDGHHRGDTYDYTPLPPRPPESAQDRATRLRTVRKLLLGVRR